MDSGPKRPPPPPGRRPLYLRLLGFLLFFFFYFLRALTLANLQLAKTVLFESRRSLRPGFLRYPVGHLSKFEIIVLSHCISLTPGTTTVEVAPDFEFLTLHALYARDPESAVRDIRSDLEDPMLLWTR